jgi:cell cycle sensor histidine kinase DivJ
MTQKHPASTDKAGHGAEALDVLRWHAGWAGAVAVATLVLRVSGLAPTTVVIALLIASAPTLGALALAHRESPGARLGLMVSWALAAALAAGLTGGLTGPLAVWCLTPLAVSGVLGGARGLAQGATLAVLSLALTALAQAMGLTAGPLAPGVAYGLGLFALALALGALAAGLLMERRRLAHQLRVERAAKESLGALLDGQPNLLLWLDPRGAVSATFGEPPADLRLDQILTGGLSSLCPPDQRADIELVLTEAAEHRRGALTFPLAGARGVWLNLELRALDGSSLVGVLRDVTVERERERDLERSRLDAEALNIGKSRFLANMSHELRTPLNAIMGFSDIMRARLFGTLPGKYGEYADLIHDAGSHLLDLINDVLDMSKIEAARYDLRIERIDAREPVSAALRLMRLQADDVGVKLRGVLPSEPLDIDADRRAIKQIVLNLISNALKFTPRGGLVTVSMTLIGGAMELSVSDTGVGIAPADLDRLGRPYEQAGDPALRSRGTGLGLSLVRAFAELHGGEMAIESQLGDGATVTVRLPVVARDVAPAAKQVSIDGDEGDHPVADASGAPITGAKVIPFKPQR